MNDSDEDIERSLKTMQWKRPSPAFLQETLELALAERRTQSFTFGALLRSIPAPIRWPLAACWLLSFFFKLATPDPIPAATKTAIAQMPASNPELMLAQLDYQKRLTADWLDELFHSHSNNKSARDPLP